MVYQLLHEEKQYLDLLKGTVLKEQKVKIPVKHPGALEVPEGKDVEGLGAGHFQTLIKKKGWGEVSKALINLKVWNKSREPKLSSWADNMQEKLAKWVESQRKSSGNEDLYESELQEKWAKDVDVKSTGQYTDKTEAELKKSIEDLKGKPGDHKKKMGQLLFALRAKQGWKKHTGA